MLILTNLSTVLCLCTTFYESELVLFIDKGGAEEEEERMETNSHSGKKKTTSLIFESYTGLDKQKILSSNCKYFLTHQF